MIDQAMILIAGQLNAHLGAQFSAADDIVAITPLTDAEGKPAANARNRLALFISNITQDPMPRRMSGAPPSSLGAVSRAKPIHLDIYFMLAAAFDAETYTEGLKMLSAALRYFQANPLMTPQNTPGMARGLIQLAVEIDNLGNQEIGQLWGNLGGRYVPSVHFRMRSIMIDADAVSDVTPVIRDADARLRTGAGG